MNKNLKEILLTCLTNIKTNSNYVYDKDGYDRHGYNAEGYTREDYDKEGYNRHGYDKEGYDKEGYNSRGYDRNGYDRNGCEDGGYDYDWCYEYNEFGIEKSYSFCLVTNKNGNESKLRYLACISLEIDRIERKVYKLIENSLDETILKVLKSLAENEIWTDEFVVKVEELVNNLGIDNKSKEYILKDIYYKLQSRAFARIITTMRKKATNYDLRTLERRFKEYTFNQKGARDRQGFDKNGYDKDGFDRYGFDIFGNRRLKIKK